MTWELVGATALALPASVPAQAQNFEVERAAMVARIRAAVREADPKADDVALARALTAIGSTAREEFVRPALRGQAYRDSPLDIGHGQTISDAYIVTVMTAAADPAPSANVLDVGTGSGYQAAVLAQLARQVSSIEIVPALADEAKARLARLGHANVMVRAGDGYAGWPERAPFDAIIVAAGAARAPRPLLAQLKIGGRLVMPIGPSWASEQLLVITRTANDHYDRCSLGWSMFVPLTGKGMRPQDAMGMFEKVPLCYASSIARVDFQAATPDR